VKGEKLLQLIHTRFPFYCHICNPKLSKIEVFIASSLISIASFSRGLRLAVLVALFSAAMDPPALRTVAVCCVVLCYLVAVTAGAVVQLPSLKRPFFNFQSPFNAPPNDDKLRRFKEWMIGAYDNEQQAAAGAARGKFSARDGGHELVTATIVPHPTLVDVLVAAYYFENDPTKVFRFRYYEFITDDVNPWRQRGHVVMRLHRPSAAAEAALKAVGYDTTRYLPALDAECEALSGCDVIWRKRPWRRHYRGELECGTCTLRSQRDPTVEIIVKDDLRLWKDALWINDRVYNKEGELLIGNRDGIPYKLRKKLGVGQQ